MIMVKFLVLKASYNTRPPMGTYDYLSAKVLSCDSPTIEDIMYFQNAAYEHALSLYHRGLEENAVRLEMEKINTEIGKVRGNA